MMDFRNMSENAIYSLVVKKLRAAGCVFAEEEARLLMSSAPTPADLASLVERRMAGLPLEHVVGWVTFYGLRLEVAADVFIPRLRTEFLAKQAIALVQPADIVVDMCCGSGALGAAIISEVQRIELHAVDIDSKAVQCARRNIAACGHVHEGNLYEPLPVRIQGHINVLIANAPYVPTEAIELLPQEARIHESRVALDGGIDGLDIQRQIAAAAPRWLAPDGYLLVETSERQAPLTEKLFAQNGLLPNIVRSDELDATVVIGKNASRDTI